MRARLAAARTLRQARHQLSGFRLRPGHHYNRPAWTLMHRVKRSEDLNDPIALWHVADPFEDVEIEARQVLTPVGDGAAASCGSFPLRASGKGR